MQKILNNNFNNKVTKIIVIILFLVMLFKFSYYILRPLLKHQGLLDYNCAYNAATAIRYNPLDLYEMDKDDDFSYTYNMPPISAIIMSPLSFYDRETGKIIWHILDFVLIIISAVILLKVFNSFFMQLMIITILFSYNPLIQSFEWGNIYNWFILCFVISLLFLKFKKNKFNETIIALFIAIPTIFKLFPGLLLVMFLLRKKYFIFFMICFWIILFNFIAVISVGWEVNWFYYTRGILRAATYPVFPIPNIQSWAGIFYRLFHVSGSVQCWINLPWLAKLLSNSFSLIFFIIFIIVTLKNKENIFLNFSFCLFSIMMIQPLVWEYALAIILPGVFILINETLERENYKYLIITLIATLIITLRMPYDHPIFRQGILLLATGIKLYAVFILWIINFKLLKSTNS